MPGPQLPLVPGVAERGDKGGMGAVAAKLKSMSPGRRKRSSKDEVSPGPKLNGSPSPFSNGVHQLPRAKSTAEADHETDRQPHRSPKSPKQVIEDRRQAENPLPRRISFHVARRPDAHTAPLPRGVITLTPGQPSLQSLDNRRSQQNAEPGPSSLKPKQGLSPLNTRSKGPLREEYLEEAAALASPGAPQAPSTSCLQGIRWQWESPRPIGAGLHNLGNTCFLNSVLQCLAYTPCLADYLTRHSVHNPGCAVAGWCALCEMKGHVGRALSQSGRVVSPQGIVRNIRSLSKLFRPGRQEDAHEFMRCLLDAMHRCSLPPVPKALRKSPGAPQATTANRLAETFVHQAFGGYLRSQVQCTECSYCSRTYDPFLDLSLDILKANSVTRALERFTQAEVLDGADKYQCSKCKKKVRALKTFAIQAAPRVLTLHLKRFDVVGFGRGMGGRKIDRHIEFEPTLDLTKFMASYRESKGPSKLSGMNGTPERTPTNKGAARVTYSLHGVLVHMGGSLHSGHYYCYVKGPSNLWHCMDDSRVTQASEGQVLKQRAYILFYTRDDPVVSASPRPLRLLSRSLSDGATEAGGALRPTSGDAGKSPVSMPRTRPLQLGESVSLGEVQAQTRPQGTPKAGSETKKRGRDEQAEQGREQPDQTSPAQGGTGSLGLLSGYESSPATPSQRTPGTPETPRAARKRHKESPRQEVPTSIPAATEALAATPLRDKAVGPSISPESASEKQAEQDGVTLVHAPSVTSRAPKTWSGARKMQWFMRPVHRSLLSRGSLSRAHRPSTLVALAQRMFAEGLLDRMTIDEPGEQQQADSKDEGGEGAGGPQVPGAWGTAGADSSVQKRNLERDGMKEDPSVDKRAEVKPTRDLGLGAGCLPLMSRRPFQTQAAEEEGEDGGDKEEQEGGGYVLAGPGQKVGSDDSESDGPPSDGEGEEQAEMQSEEGERKPLNRGKGEAGMRTEDDRGQGKRQGVGRDCVVVARGAEAGRALKQQAGAGGRSQEGGSWGLSDVPSWWQENFMSTPSSVQSASASSKKHRYDEWDEELDRGRVKKVKAKKSPDELTPWSNAENPFQHHSEKKPGHGKGKHHKQRHSR